MEMLLHGLGGFAIGCAVGAIASIFKRAFGYAEDIL